MKHYFFRLRAVFLCAATLGPPGPRAGAEPATEPERRAIDARRAIRTAHVVFVRRVIDNVPRSTYAPNMPADFKIGPIPNRRYEVWLDGDLLRADVTPEGSPPENTPAAIGQRRTVGRNWPEKGKIIDYTFLKTTVRTAEADGPYGTATTLIDSLIDPRTIGFSTKTLPNMLSAGLEASVGNPKRRDVRAEQVTWKGEDAWLVQSTYMPSASDNRIWLLPGKGYNPTRILTAGRNKKDQTPWEYEINVDLAQDSVSGIWFPKRSVLEQRDKGALEFSETVEVLEAELNRPIDPGVFTLAGLRLPVGTPIDHPDPGRPHRYWDGTKVVDKNPNPVVVPPAEAAAAPVPVEPVPDAGVKWWYVLLAVGFAVAAVALLRRAVARRG